MNEPDVQPDDGNGYSASSSSAGGLERSVDRWLSRPGIIETWVRLWIPPVLFLCLMGTAMTLRPDLAGAVVARTSSVLLVGKIAAAGGQEEFWTWVAVLGTADALIGLFIILNFDHLKRLPNFGQWIRGMEATGHAMCERQPWVRRLSVLGVSMVIFLPVHGTGTIAGALMGRIIGLGLLRTLIAVLLGAYSGVALVLVGSATIYGLFRQHWGFALLGILMIVSLLVLVYRKLVR